MHHLILLVFALLGVIAKDRPAASAERAPGEKTVAGSGAADVPGFAGLPHQSRSLVQAGSGNLLPSPDFKDGLRGWTIKGDASLVDREGEKILRFGPRQNGQSASVRVYLPKPKPSTLYHLAFEVKMTPEVELDQESEYRGLQGWFAPVVAGAGPARPIKLEHRRRGTEWVQREFRVFTPPEVASAYISLTFTASKGEALTRRWELIAEPILGSAGLVVLETPSGQWAELPRSPQPPAPTEPVLWAAEDADRLLPTSRPTPAERTAALELAGAPGEMCVAAIGLYTPRATSGVVLSCEELHGPAGRLSATPGWKAVAYQPRRTDYYGRGATFHRVADFFVARRAGVACPAGQTSGFWINLRLPLDAAPGVYEGRLHARAAGLEVSLPVRVKVYPFHLAELPLHTRHLYLDENRWRKMSDEQVLAELADVRDHGYESISLGCRGTVEMKEGRVAGYELSEEAKRGVRLALRAKLRGSLLFWPGWVPDHLARKLNLPAPPAAVKTDPRLPALAGVMVDTLKLLREQLIGLGVARPVLVAIDEPGYWKPGSPERLAWDVRTAHDAGWPVYCSSSYEPSDPLGRGLDYHCYSGGRLYDAPVRARRIAEETRAAGQRLWYYCTGCYSGQVGNLVRNRYLAGFFFHRCGAEGTASWTFQRPQGNPFDDFGAELRRPQGDVGQACITYPDPEQPGVNLDTPQWEGLRQAWYDHRYAETLVQAITAARGQRRVEADRAEKRLAALLAELPWNGEPFIDRATSNSKLTRLRAAITEEIVRLREAQGGGLQK